MGIIAGAAAAAFIDKPLSGMISNPTMRGAIKAGIGVFLNGKPGIMGSVGAGMIAAGGIQVLGAMMPGAFGADVPALISDEFGYEADEIGDEFGEDFDDMGEDFDDMGEDFDDMGEITYSNELAGIEGV